MLKYTKIVGYFNHAYLGHLSCIPFVCVTRKVQEVLSYNLKCVV